MLKPVAQHLCGHRSARRNRPFNTNSHNIISTQLLRGKEGVLIPTYVCAALLIAVSELQRGQSLQSNMILKCSLPVF